MFPFFKMEEITKSLENNTNTTLLKSLNQDLTDFCKLYRAHVT